MFIGTLHLFTDGFSKKPHRHFGYTPAMMHVHRDREEVLKRFSILTGWGHCAQRWTEALTSRGLGPHAPGLSRFWKDYRIITSFVIVLYLVTTQILRGKVALTKFLTTIDPKRDNFLFRNLDTCTKNTTTFHQVILLSLRIFDEWYDTM